jgi:large conductance mechanosensitive channel
MKEFKKFISKGNVIELAVGLIMATYFGAIVKSLVNDIVMPPIGSLLGRVDFADFKYVIQSAQPETKPGAGDGLAEIAISYGLFINNIITFLIVALSIFIALKAINKMKEKLEAELGVENESESKVAAAPSPEEVLLIEIRDLLKQQKGQ